ncbi:MAG: glycosyltransferase family 4 protein [Muribaculaceae bacterium]|nr:glycosyltransferase family 4 protein [Muribaculaceae bacterium]
MNVLVTIPCLLTGGTEVQTLALVEALIAAGHKVCVGCYFEHAPSMVERYRRAGASVRLFSPDGTRPQGIRRVTMHLLRNLRATVREFRPDVAHVQYMAPGAIPILLLKLSGVKKIVATAHTAADIYSPRGLQIIQWLSRRTLTGFQCITLAAEKSFFGSAAYFTPDTTIEPGAHFTINNTLPSTMTITDRKREIGSALVIGVVSRLEPIKGMDLVIPAFAEAAKVNPELNLIVAGDGSQRNLMEDQSRQLGISDRVRFIGRQLQENLPGVYDEIDILLMPSRSEGFGLTAIEGMARGCVLLASSIGGLPEVVIPEVGFTYLPDQESLGDALKRVATTPKESLQKLSDAARERARLFTPDRYREKIANLYKKIESAK